MRGWHQRWGEKGRGGSEQMICRIGVEATEPKDESQRRRQYFP